MHPLKRKADRKGRKWLYRMRMKAKVDRKAARWLVGKRNRSCSASDGKITTKEHSSQNSAFADDD